MKVFYTISPLLLLLPVALALPLHSVSNAEAVQHQTLKAKRLHEDSANNVLARRNEVSTGYETSEKLEPDCDDLPHKKVFHHRPNKLKAGGGVPNSNQNNSPADAQWNSTVMPAVAPQPMTGPSPGQSPPAPPGKAAPNYRPAVLGSVALHMGHGPVVPGHPWTAPSETGSPPPVSKSSTRQFQQY